MRITLEYPNCKIAENITDEMRRVADLIDDGFTNGVLMHEGGRGWWKINDSSEVVSLDEQSTRPE